MELGPYMFTEPDSDCDISHDECCPLRFWAVTDLDISNTRLREGSAEHDGILSAKRSSDTR